MSKIKKIFSVFVAMLMLLSAFPIIPVFAETESGKCGENTVWEYNAETSTLTISGIGDMYDYELYESPWRKAGIKEINEVILEDGIRYIGNCSFAGISINRHYHQVSLS